MIRSPSCDPHDAIMRETAATRPDAPEETHKGVL